MTPEEIEAIRHNLCGKSAGELLAASAECRAARCEYVRKMARRQLTVLELMEMANIDELHDAINEAKDALAALKAEAPWVIAPTPRVRR